MKKRIFSLIIGLILSISIVTTGCGGKTPPDDGSEIKEGTTVLNIANYEGGLGEEWIKEAAKDFEELYAETPFEEGKKGVSVVVYSNKDYTGTNIIDKMGAYKNLDLFVTEWVSYLDFVGKGALADISDIVNEPLTEFGESKSIADKLGIDNKEYLTAKDGKYYALPYYDGFYGFTYDVELFNKNRFFFKSNGQIGAKLGEDDLGYGPDNEKGTYDDGLPQTYEQFFMLCEEMQGLGITPIAYSANSYMSRTMSAMWTDYEGYDNMRVAFNFDGKVDTVKSISGTGYNATIETQETTIKNENGYDVQQQVGKYYALTFLENIVRGNGTDSYYKTMGSGGTEIQKSFIKGGLSNEFEKFGMINEGSWWENEASNTFISLSQIYENAERNDRKFAFMPFPKATAADVGKESTLLSYGNSFVFINSSTTKLDLAKKFMQFIHTDAQLSQFTRLVSCTRPFDYKVSEIDYEGMSYYGKSIVDLKKNSKIVYPYSSSNLFINNESFFHLDTWGWTAIVDSVQYKHCAQAFIDSKTMTAKKYFDGLYTYFAGSAWNTVKGK